MLQTDNNPMTTKKIWISSCIFSLALLLFVLVGTPLVAQDTSGAANQERFLQLFQYVYNFIQKNYVDEVDPEVLYEGAIKGMLESIGDPYTSYIDSESMTSLSLRDTTTGSFGGVGLSITKPIESTPEKPAWVEVASPIEDTPGWRAGIQPGDFIISIDGQSTAEISMEDVLSRLRGPVGTPVTVQMRRGKALDYSVTLTRALIEVPTVKYQMMDSGIGYLRIIEFTPLTAERVQDALKHFSDSGYSSLLIDLRNNPGGLITSVVDVADKFISSGTIVSTRSRISWENREFRARQGTTLFNAEKPVVVLINRGSASAAEILAGALKDYRLAYLVGETTFGKGSVQQVVELQNQDAMKITMARYYTPSDANIDKTGIIPDLAVSFPEMTVEEEKSLSELLQTSRLADFVSGKDALADKDVEAFVDLLARDYQVEKRVLKRLVLQEYYRTHLGPLYDLEYDVQLRSAVDVLLSGRVPELLKSTRTVREMQELEATKEADRAQ